MGQRAGAGGAELGDRPWEGAVFGLSRPPPAPAPAPVHDGRFRCCVHTSPAALYALVIIC